MRCAPEREFADTLVGIARHHRTHPGNRVPRTRFSGTSHGSTPRSVTPTTARDHGPSCARFSPGLTAYSPRTAHHGGMGEDADGTPAEPPGLRVGHDERAAALRALDTHFEAGRLDVTEYGE